MRPALCAFICKCTFMLLRWLQLASTMTWQFVFPIVNRQFYLARQSIRALSRVSSAQSFTSAFKHLPAMELKGRVIVYSILGCPHCMRAKNSLQELRLPYSDVGLDKFPQCRQELQTRTGKKTVPQIFFNAVHVGGNDDLQKLIAEDKTRLNELIEDVKNNQPPKDAPQLPDPSTAVEDADTGDFTCEPDEYARLVQELRQSGLIADHRQGLTVHKKSFMGKEFVDWVVKNKGLERDRAVEMGQQLVDKHFSHQVKTGQETFRDDKVYYRLLDDDDSVALNDIGQMSECEPRQASDLGGELRKLILKLYNAFLSKDGRKVNYAGIGGSSEFERYTKLTKELLRVQIVDATREEKLAFFVNVYNALVIHANIVKGPATNLWQRYKFFNTVKYMIGGVVSVLQHSEVHYWGCCFSSSTHEVHDWGVGAESCPPIKTYTPEGVIEQLQTAAEAFLDGPDGCQVDVAKKTLFLSQIFKWYGVDFGQNSEEVAQWVYKNMGEGEKKDQLKEVLAAKKFKVSYLHYDWSVNS
ncbi:uncharacterized protein LOC124274466 [Haliotis rubra]|uniref:uncharacterized protein LOC124274466 n=1 Tax=Haliotis rubra TaxID=36100 RepID=UPI001EE56403|nr:uncharacterized protein LOC124274466 [Haliotis rubra]